MGESGFWACVERVVGLGPQVRPLGSLLLGLSVSSLGGHSGRWHLVRNVAVPLVPGGDDGHQVDVRIVSRVAHTCFSLTHSCRGAPLIWKGPGTFQFIPLLCARCCGGVFPDVAPASDNRSSAQLRLQAVTPLPLFL